MGNGGYYQKRDQSGTLLYSLFGVDCSCDISICGKRYHDQVACSPVVIDARNCGGYILGGNTTFEIDLGTDACGVAVARCDRSRIFYFVPGDDSQGEPRREIAFAVTLGVD